MTDHELTVASALAMGFTILYDRSIGNTPYLDCEDRVGKRVYMMWCPLKSDEQCMALVKKFELCCAWQPNMGAWWVHPIGGKPESYAQDLNRAIVECVAKMETAE